MNKCSMCGIVPDKLKVIWFYDTEFMSYQVEHVCKECSKFINGNSKYIVQAEDNSGDYEW